MSDTSEQADGAAPQTQLDTQTGLSEYFTEEINRRVAGKRILGPLAALALVLSGCDAGSTKPTPTKTPSEYDPNLALKWKSILNHKAPDCNMWTNPLNSDGTAPATTAVNACTPTYLAMSQEGKNFAELDNNAQQFWGLDQYKVEATIDLGNTAIGTFGALLVDTTWADQPSGYMLVIYEGKFIVLDATKSVTVLMGEIKSTGGPVKAEVIRARSNGQTNLYFYINGGVPVCTIPTNEPQNRFARFGLVSGNNSVQNPGAVHFSDVAISVPA